MTRPAEQLLTPCHPDAPDLPFIRARLGGHLDELNELIHTRCRQPHPWCENAAAAGRAPAGWTGQDTT